MSYTGPQSEQGRRAEREEYERRKEPTVFERLALAVVVFLSVGCVAGVVSLAVLVWISLLFNIDISRKFWIMPDIIPGWIIPLAIGSVAGIVAAVLADRGRKKQSF